METQLNKTYPDVNVGEKVVFIGHPSYKQGLKGEVSYRSEHSPEVIKVKFNNGTEMITDTFQVKVL